MHISYKAHNFKEKGTSSKGVFEYLTKEDLDKEEARFFNHDSNNITIDEAVKGIDENKGAHGNKVAKFYLINVSPSKKELEYLDQLAEKFSNTTEINNVSKAELKRKYFNLMLEEYAKKTMENYAENFNRDKKVDDLVYYAKIEHKRSYKEYENDVKHNKNIDKLIKENPNEKEDLEKLYNRNSQGKVLRLNMEKEGFNSHIHIVVSRYEKEGEIREKASLSPMSKAIESTGFNNSKVGFSRDEMSNKSEKTFDEMFSYERQHNEKYQEFKNKKERENNNQNSNSTIKYELKKYVKDTVIDILESNKLIDRNVPTSLTDLKNNLEYQIKKDTGLQETLNPLKPLTGEYSKLIDYSDKGIDTGY